MKKFVFANLFFLIFSFQSFSQPFILVNSGIENIERGIVRWGDYDNDGDLDILLAGTNLDGLPSTLLYRNDVDNAFAGSYFSEEMQFEVLVSGINNHSSGLFSVYPNPTTEKLFISSSAGFT